MRILSVVALPLALAFAPVCFAKVHNLERPHVPGQLIVHFDQSVQSKVAARDAILEQIGAKVLHTFVSSRAVLVDFPKAQTDFSLFQAADRLLKQPGVKLVEANQILFMDARIPNDARFGELYGLHNDGGTGGTAGADIDAPEAWDVTTGSRDVLVAVIDTGVDYTHPDLAANYWFNPGETGTDASGADKRTNGIDDDGNGFIDDWRGWDFVNNDNDPMDDNNHGTHCAGTIGASGNDGVGVAGVNWTVSIVGVKFLSAAGSGSLADAVKAIEYSTSLGVTLSSNSWGGGGYSEAMAAAITAADNAGILFVAAAGNSASDNDAMPHFPSSYEMENVVAVAATDHNDAKSNFSCFGLTSVDLGAPGTDILSTTPRNTYAKYSGTSMATPHVAGVAALIKAAYPDATHRQIKDRLLNTADPLPALEGKTVSGGRANAFNALENDNLPPGAATNLTFVRAGQTSVDVKWTAAGDDGSAGTAKRYEVRMASRPISGIDDWNAAVGVRTTIRLGTDTDEVHASLVDLPFNTSGYYAVRATDNVGNTGPISESAPFSVQEVRMVAENRAETLDGTTADAPWALEAVGQRTGFAFSDSPGGDYQNNVAAAITLDTITTSTPDVTLVFKTKFNIETGYDFGHVELSTDNGTTWHLVDKLTGSRDWMMRSYGLAELLAGSTSFQLRFRLTTDYSITRDGWHVDDIQVFAPIQ